jgi:hypothetical protein
VRLALAVSAAFAVAGCGGTVHRAAASPCSPRVTAAAGPHARADVVSRDFELVTCRYASSTEAVRVTVDTAPQAWVRWQRAQVERTQTAVEWANVPSQQPRNVTGVGLGAFWVLAPRELVASDGHELLTVRVLAPSGAAAARQAAIRVARASLQR